MRLDGLSLAFARAWAVVVIVLTNGVISSAWSQDFDPEFDPNPRRDRIGIGARPVSGRNDVFDQLGPRLPDVTPADRRPSDRPAATTTAPLPITLNKGASVNPKRMKVVEDNVIGVRYEERDLYFDMLDLAQTTSFTRQVDAAIELRERQREAHPRFSKRPSPEFPEFVDLFEHPDDYRGKPVTLQGVLRQLTKFDPGPNKHGITEAYEGWVFTEDSQQNPFVVVFSRKPESLPVSGDLAEEVRVTGYFMKMYGYEAQDVPRSAPLLIADALEWRASAKPYVAERLGLESYLLVGFVVLTLGYSVYHSNRIEMTRSARVMPEVDFTHFPPREYSLSEVVVAAETDDA